MKKLVLLWVLSVTGISCLGSDYSELYEKRRSRIFQEQQAEKRSKDLIMSVFGPKKGLALINSGIGLWKIYNRANYIKTCRENGDFSEEEIRMKALQYIIDKAFSRGLCERIDLFEKDESSVNYVEEYLAGIVIPRAQSGKGLRSIDASPFPTLATGQPLSKVTTPNFEAPFEGVSIPKPMLVPVNFLNLRSTGITPVSILKSGSVTPEPTRTGEL